MIVEQSPSYTPLKATKIVSLTDIISFIELTSQFYKRSKSYDRQKILILNSLEDIIKSKRYHEVKIDDIAKKCKIGKGTIYTYFQSKEEMYYELAMHGLEVVIQEINNISIEDRDIKKVIFKVADKLNIFF